MSKFDEVDYWVPEHVREYLRSMGFQLPLEPMESYIRSWHEWMQASGSFYDYRDSDGFGRIYEVHRRSIHPAMRVCREWGSLLLNDKTQVVCEDQACTDWLQEYFTQTGFFPSAQATAVRAFGMGTGAWALWIDAGRKDVRIRRYDARMVIPLSWDEEHVTECAFVTRAFYRGQAVDQLQMHLLGGDGAEPSTASPSTLSQSMHALGLSSPSLSHGMRSLPRLRRRRRPSWRLVPMRSLPNMLDASGEFAVTDWMRGLGLSPSVIGHQRETFTSGERFGVGTGPRTPEARRGESALIRAGP